MRKKPSNFRLSAAAVACLARLQASSGDSQANIIADAVLAYERQKGSPVRQALLDAYDSISDAIQRIGATQDQRALEPEEWSAHGLLYRFWEEIRAEPLFTEPPLPDAGRGE